MHDMLGRCNRGGALITRDNGAQDFRMLLPRAGDVLDVELSLGSLHFDAEDYRPLLMVATGTGLGVPHTRFIPASDAARLAGPKSHRFQLA